MRFLDGIEPRLPGRRVHQPFHDVEPLGPAGAAIGIGGHGVGEAGGDVRVEGGNTVGIRRHQGAEGGGDRPP